MAAVPVEILLGVYLGLLTGIIPALVAGGMGFLFKYFTGVSIPALAVVVLSLALAGANGGLLALNDPTVRGAPNSITLTTAIIVVLMTALYAHAKGDTLGAEFPKHFSLRRITDRTLSADVVDLVGGRGQVRVAVGGTVDDLEGYPPLSSALRARLAGETWALPADLPISELETRVADALRSEFDLADVAVSIDERGQATIAAAPPTGGVSKRVPAGRRAVSIRALVPTGLARGDEAIVRLPDGTVEGTVVSARSDLPDTADAAEVDRTVETDGGTEEGAAEPLPTTPTTEGGDGRITLAVRPEAAARLLDVDRAHVVVSSRGTRREFELVALLRRAGKRFRKLTVGTAGPLVGTSIGDAAVRDEHGVVILGIRRPDGWTIAPGGSATLAAGHELFVVGGPARVEAFREAVS